MNGNSLKFDSPFTATNIPCTGGFDQTAFIEKIRRVDSYDVVDHQLRLKQGSEVLMVLAKNANQ